MGRLPERSIGYPNIGRFVPIQCLVFTFACAPSPEDLLDQAMERIHADDCAGALSVLNQITRDDPKNPHAWLKTAECNNTIGNIHGAVDALFRAPALQPTATLEKAGDMETALEAYRKAASFPPTYARALRSRARVALVAGRTDTAVSA